MAVFFIRAERVFFNGKPIYLIENGFDSCAYWKLRLLEAPQTGHSF